MSLGVIEIISLIIITAAVFWLGSYLIRSNSNSIHKRIIPNGYILRKFNKKGKSNFYVEGVGNIPICCNQTARLGEAYCKCGRAVPLKLRKYYSPTPLPKYQH